MSLAFRNFQPVDVPDVGMVQRGQDFGFTLKASHAIRIGGEGFAHCVGVQGLERNCWILLVNQ